jgi:cobalamin biosynthesis protein CobD/CbiB
MDTLADRTRKDANMKKIGFGIGIVMIILAVVVILALIYIPDISYWIKVLLIGYIPIGALGGLSLIGKYYGYV